MQVLPLPNQSASVKKDGSRICHRPTRDSRDAINAENVRINLRYDRADLKSLLPPRLNIWTHNFNALSAAS